MNKYLIMLLSLIGVTQPKQMAPFKPFEQCINVEESQLRAFSSAKQKSIIKDALSGKQGSFFTQK